MGVYIGGLIVAIGLLVHAIYLRICYFKHEAVCLEHSTYEKLFITFPLYEYELMEAGKKVAYKKRGETYFYPRKGKRYKVLINKDNHNKVIGYMKYVVHLLVGSLLSVMFLVVIFCN